jgi:mycothiol synthase
LTHRLEVVPELDPAEVEAVALLVERATEVDGVRPLSEHVSLHLRHGGDTGDRSLLLYAPADTGERLVGYAHLDPTDLVRGPSAELVIDPDYRRQGLGRRLVQALRAETPGSGLRVWAHGLHPAGEFLASTLGFDSQRELWQMRRSLYAPLPPMRLPAGVELRPFVPGKDDAAWLAVNAAAFAEHPEQGRWTAADLSRRRAESWFDPDGFLLAERGSELVGFHWTKVHGTEPHVHDSAEHDPQGGHRHEHPSSPGPAGSDHGHERLGEVYVVGVLPSERGSGLGRALMLAGLNHLRAAGLATAMLYVDADNEPAIRLYERLGFTHWDTDVEFQADA